MSVCEHCGVISDGKGHSDPARRMFFAVVDKAWDCWPESEKFQPADSYHLRAFLLVKVGHFDKLDLRCENPDATSLEDQLRVVLKTISDGKPTLMHTYEWGIRIFWPRSVAKRAIEPKLFNEIATRVYELLEVKLGVPIDQLKREAEQNPSEVVAA